MSQCGYACFNCGQCRGKLPEPIYVRRCIRCGHVNEPGSRTCAACNESLGLQAGVTNTVGANFKMLDQRSEPGNREKR